MSPVCLLFTASDVLLDRCWEIRPSGFLHLGDYTEPNKLDFIIHTGYNAWWKVNKCTEMDENKVESGKIP